MMKSILLIAIGVLFGGITSFSITATMDNTAELNGEFALDHAPVFSASDEQRHITDQVIDEMKKGYGGTMVCNPSPDPSLDTAAFLSRYLREFSTLGKKETISSYDYRYERILVRLYESGTSLDDPKLDWDMWRSYLLFENLWDGSSHYRAGESDGFPIMLDLHSARDLLWMYLARHGERLAKDPKRRQWWIDHLSRRLGDPKASPMRCWFLLQLCAHADDSVPFDGPSTTQKTTPSDPQHVELRRPTPMDPFFIVEKDAPLPLFAEALNQITRPLGLRYVVWGVHPEALPRTRVLSVRLQLKRWPIDEAFIIAQDSWSNPKSEWGGSLSHVVDKRVTYSNASFPCAKEQDGVYFFVFKKQLHVWPKAKMATGVLQMLHSAKLIDDVTWKRFQTQGFRELQTTLTSP